jgi:hypothetical protein
MSGYIEISDLHGENRYYENFAQQLYGSASALTTAGSVALQADIDHWARWMDGRMRTVNRFSVLPVQKNRNGSHDQSLQAWNSYLVVYHKLVSRFGVEFEQIPQSVEHFGTMADLTGSMILEGAIIFDEEIDSGELGIGQPEVVGTLDSNTRGTFFNNWRGWPFGDSLLYEAWSKNGAVSAQMPSNAALDSERGFLGRDYPRTWIVDMIEAGGIGTSKYRFSMNGGKDWEGTNTTDEDWEYIDDGVWFRFAPDDAGSHVFGTADRWKFQTVPTEIKRTFGSSEARIGKAGRGF